MKRNRLFLLSCLCLVLVEFANADTINGNQNVIGNKVGGNLTVNYSPSKEEINKIADNLLKKYKDTLDGQIKKSITQAISNLGKGQNIAGNEQQIKDAFAALKRGDTSEAKALFTKTAENAVENAKTAKQSENEANKQAAEAYRNLGALAFLDNTQEALQAYRHATELDPDNADSWNNLGHLLDRVGDLDEAIAAYSKLLALGETHQDQVEIAAAYCNLGTIYETRGELDKAIEFQQKSLTIDESMGNKEGMAQSYGNLGNVYKTRGELDKAIEFYQKSLKIHESMGKKEGMAADYGNLGIVYQKRGELDKAVEFSQKSLAIAEALGIQEITANQYGNLGIVYEQQGNKAETKRYWKKSVELYRHLGSPIADKVQTWLDELH